MSDATHHQAGPVFLDDGAFYIELDGQLRSDLASGFLQHRCYPGVTTPNGCECVGRFELDAQGRWAVSIDAPYREDNGGDRRHLGAFSDRLDAIAASWGARHAAHCRHQAD